MADRIRRSRAKCRRQAIYQETQALQDLIGDLPKKNEVIRFVTLQEFSATGLIAWITDKEPVEWFGCVTLRVGKRCSALIKQLVDENRIKSADFILGHLSAERHGAERDAANLLQEICDEKGWSLMAARNHAKVLLFRTASGFYVVETSGNLNDFPNWEQFLIENDEDLFNWYRDLFWGSGLTYPMPEENEKKTEEEWQDQDNPWTCLSLKGRNT